MSERPPASREFWRKVTYFRSRHREEPESVFVRRRAAAAERAVRLVEDGVSSRFAFRLAWAGYGTLAEVREAPDAELLRRVREFGRPSLRALRDEIGPALPWRPPHWMTEE